MHPKPQHLRSVLSLQPLSAADGGLAAARNRIYMAAKSAVAIAAACLHGIGIVAVAAMFLPLILLIGAALWLEKHQWRSGNRTCGPCLAPDGAVAQHSKSSGGNSEHRSHQVKHAAFFNAFRTWSA